MRALLVTLLLALLVPLGATSAGAAPAPAAEGAAAGAVTAERAAVRRPPVVARWDYQIGGARAVPKGVRVVVRDRHARPTGRYDVCYVNAFQTQPGEKGFWRDRWHLVLKDADGDPVVDEGWGEWLLDLRTDAKQRQLSRIVGRWFAGCARDGFDAVEPDNLDSFARSEGLITRAQTKAFSRLLVRAAHRSGLAIAQKNWAEMDGSRLGFDFAVAESCARWSECGRYHAAYGRRVLAVEYGDAPFARACRSWGDRLAVVRRDRAVSPDGVRRWC